MNPVDYIAQFGGKYLTMRNRNAQFTYSKNQFSALRIRNAPLDVSEMTRLDFIYEDDKNTTVNTTFLLGEVVNSNDDEVKESFFDFAKTLNPLFKKNENLPFDFDIAWEKYFKKYPQMNKYNFRAYRKYNSTTSKYK